MPEANNPNKTEKLNEKTKPILHSFSKDLAEAVREHGGESFKIARKEETAREAETKILNQTKKTNKLYFILGGILIISTLFVLNILKSKKAATPLPKLPRSAIIFFDSEQKIDLTGLSRDKLLGVIREVKRPVNSGEVANLAIRQRTALGETGVDFAQFLNALKITPPENLMRYLEKVFMYGLYGGEKTTPFLLLNNFSFADTLTGLRDWETHMVDDLHDLLDFNISGENAYLRQAKFRDELLKNKNARVLRTKDGELVLFYIFLNEPVVLIGRNEITLEEILLRLYSPRKR